jgi:hypothetical protein
MVIGPEYKQPVPVMLLVAALHEFALDQVSRMQLEIQHREEQQSQV